MLSVCVDASRTFTISSCKAAERHADVVQEACIPGSGSLAPKRQSEWGAICLQESGRSGVQATEIGCSVTVDVALSKTILQPVLQSFTELRPQDMSVPCSAS